MRGRARGACWQSRRHCEGDVCGGLHPGCSVHGQNSRGDPSALQGTPCDCAAFSNGHGPLTNQPPGFPQWWARGIFQSTMKATFAPSTRMLLVTGPLPPVSCEPGSLQGTARGTACGMRCPAYLGPSRAHGYALCHFLHVALDATPRVGLFSGKGVLPSCVPSRPRRPLWAEGAASLWREGVCGPGPPAERTGSEDRDTRPSALSRLPLPCSR